MNVTANAAHEVDWNKSIFFCSVTPQQIYENSPFKNNYLLSNNVRTRFFSLKFFTYEHNKTDGPFSSYMRTQARE